MHETMVLCLPVQLCAGVRVRSYGIVCFVLCFGVRFGVPPRTIHPSLICTFLSNPFASHVASVTLLLLRRFNSPLKARVALCHKRHERSDASDARCASEA